MKRSTLAICIVLFLLIPLTLFLGSRLPGRSYYLTGTLIAIYLLVPFFLAFEGRRPQARELVLIAVLCALAVASRVVVPIPQFKPVYGIIMLCGVAFGAESGFLVGALTAFISNFFAGQGPYTPWQMLAYGVAGLIAGLISKSKRNHPLELAFWGFFISFLVVGPLLDTCSVVLVLPKLTVSGAIPIYLSGIPVNLLQAVSTFLTLLLLSSPMLKKIDRIQKKYGLISNQ